MTYEEWIKKVDEAVKRKVGCSVHDLADCNFRDWYEDGVSAASAAKRAIRNEFGED